MTSIPTSIVALTLVLAGDSPWKLQESGTKSRFRGLSVVSDQVAWASGSQGTIVKTSDGGLTWNRLTVPDSEKLDFRDIHAFDEQSACVLSIGSGELSRIYRTGDGGKTWICSYINRDPKGFLDAIAFWNASEGLALGDPVNGRFVILKTSDGGRNWAKIPESGMPDALPGEGAFAASGTCLITGPGNTAWFGTGGGKSARVFRASDRGRKWEAVETSLRAGIASAGVFSIAFCDVEHGLIVGGDYKSLDDPIANLAITSNGGQSWDPIGEGQGPSGFRSAVEFVPLSGRLVVAVGPSGSDVSTNLGLSWSKLEGPGFHALGFDRSGKAGWAVGEEGRIGKLDPAYFRSHSR